jgi:hypothetical protein
MATSKPESPSEALGRHDGIIVTHSHEIAALRERIAYLESAVEHVSELSLESNQNTIVDKTRASFGKFPIPFRK